ncbi:hypothetical protein AB205_0114160 [Aquarana catesbeiana]|uniref:Uncharacterized protein n=1 Tax=Aquarana catesbeiana TaxID=8400 RepID=A0A2G9S1R6_AQUCT|nr:hypothetical protein AB205_0114160 [Aquarana catesbeiana]
MFSKDSSIHFLCIVNPYTWNPGQPMETDMQCCAADLALKMPQKFTLNRCECRKWSFIFLALFGIIEQSLWVLFKFPISVVMMLVALFSQ